MDERAAVIERYQRFAREEAPGRCEVYRAWAERVTTDVEVAAVLERIPATHRQPPLVFAVTRMLGAADTLTADGWADFVGDNAERIVAEASERTLQTNEPLRSVPLLVALSQITGPIALIELGASAGLCLYPDRHAYRLIGDDGTVTEFGSPGSPVLEAHWNGEAPRLRLPQIVQRVGVDLHPRDARDPADRAWIEGLVWPGETGRGARIRAALELAASDPPRLIAGDAADLDLLDECLASVPDGATAVVTTPGVLPYLPRDRRETLISGLRSRAADGVRWITLDAPGLHEGWARPIDQDRWPGGSALALDGEVIAAVDPLGAWVRPMRAGSDALLLRMLAFEAARPRHDGEKEEAIRREFDLSPARYYLHLESLIDQDAALAIDPVTVNRLRRVRDDRRRQRARLTGG